MRILALEPYYGGSHRAFLDGWVSRSRHDWTLLTLPAYRWKWRMRHAPITLAGEVAIRHRDGERWDAVFCSDMLNLAEWRGLLPADVPRLPAVVYFHENQLTYPTKHHDERDVHFGFCNMLTALSAEAVWWNSAFHRDEMLAALAELLARMPGYNLPDVPDRIRERSSIQPPGVDEFPPRGPRSPGPLRILWAARWEFDKDPETFFAAIRLLAGRGVDFRLSVIGESFREVPEVFAQAKEEFAASIDRWGYQSSRADYEAALSECDVFVSTAQHEFFGITAVEAITAGAYPLLPRRLAYPELLAASDANSRDEYFYDGTAESLAKRLEQLAISPEQLPADLPMQRFHWSRRVPKMDEAIERIAEDRHSERQND
ncbi:MAG: DUF3524 domain-containing protein [Planctomycetes bacterium]|nr:DUF3524 domain-containing protein [Planctomycetota bacterium]